MALKRLNSIVAVLLLQPLTALALGAGDSGQNTELCEVRVELQGLKRVGSTESGEEIFDNVPARRFLGFSEIDSNKYFASLDPSGNELKTVPCGSLLTYFISSGYSDLSHSRIKVFINGEYREDKSNLEKTWRNEYSRQYNTYGMIFIR